MKLKLIDMVSLLSGLITIATGFSAFGDIHISPLGLFILAAITLALSISGSVKYHTIINDHSSTSKKQTQIGGNNNSQNMQ